ncbi:SIR2 family transcriptional regulator [Ceratobasidium sp. AG-Ba]|nr:SIR2 family transcriptional regulator [Ceratobasidium sp. AG-Ba]
MYSFEQQQKRDGQSELLLVIGTSLTTEGAARLVRLLSCKVHLHQGVVVYIGRAASLNAQWARHFDLYIDGDIDEWAADACKYLTTAESSGGQAKIRSRGALKVTQMFQHIRADPRLYMQLRAHSEQIGAAEMALGTRPGQSKSLMVLICHSGTAEGLAESLALALMELSSHSGWECRCYAVVLSGTSDLSRLVPPWGDYRLLTIHLTDSLCYLGQLADLEKSPAQVLAQLVEMSVPPIKTLAECSVQSVIVLVSTNDGLEDFQQAVLLDGLFKRYRMRKAPHNTLN